MLLLYSLPRVRTCFLGVIKYFEVVGKYHEVMVFMLKYYFLKIDLRTKHTFWKNVQLFYMAVQIAFLKIHLHCFRTQYAVLRSAIIWSKLSQHTHFQGAGGKYQYVYKRDFFNEPPTRVLSVRLHGKSHRLVSEFPKGLALSHF